MRSTLWLVCLCLVVTAIRAGDPAKLAPIPPDAARVIARVNVLRKFAGLDAVTYDTDKSAGCVQHAKFLVIHDDEVWEDDKFNAHDEIEGAAGFSPGGQAAARRSVIAWEDALPAVDNHFNGLYHRVPFLDPRLTAIAFGSAQGTKWGFVSVIDVLSFVDQEREWPKDRVILYPADRQKEVPTTLAPEDPNPIPADTDGTGGYPVTATFAPGVKVTGVRASMKVQNGKDVPVWLSTPEVPVDARYQRNSICLIAKDPLAASTVYVTTIEATVDGKEWKKSWAFATAATDRKSGARGK